MADARSALIALGALNAAIAVAAGAFAAHGLRDRLDPQALAVFETAARYHMYHAIAIVLAGRGATPGGARRAPGHRDLRPEEPKHQLTAQHPSRLPTTHHLHRQLSIVEIK